MTPHIECDKSEIASLVIMPGDPRRAKYIAEKYLTDVKLVNSVREEYAYTGYYKDKRVTIFSSGMGNASMGIYSHELFNIYNVSVILRVGSCGSYISDINVHDVLLLSDVYSHSSYAYEYAGISDKVMASSEQINKIIEETAQDLNIKIKSVTGNNVDAFYGKINKEELQKYNAKVVEMESFALFTNAKFSKKLASTLVTVSDSFVTKEKISSLERETDFDKMIILALESIIRI